MESFYRTSYSRALHNYVVNGFFERDLDADDLEFLEHVRHSGSANGSLPSSDTVLLEELDFWRLPYTVAPEIDRRLGPRQRVVMTAEQRAIKQARTSIWHARRIINREEKAIAALALEQEKLAWEAEKAKARERQAISDAEWERAAPKRAAFGKVDERRRYVPQWKLDEERAAKAEAKAEKSREKALKRKHRIKVIMQDYAQEHAQVQEERRLESERKIAEARETIRRNERHRLMPSSVIYPTADRITVKLAIMRLIDSVPGKVWKREAIARALGCETHDDNELLGLCLKELLDNGRLRPGGEP